MTEPEQGGIIAEDIRGAEFCLAGVRTWLNANGVGEMLPLLFTSGIPIPRIRSFDCPLGNKLCDVAEARIAEELSNGQ